MLPKILIFHTLRWPNAARLAIAFRQVGCRVDTLSLPDYPMRKLDSVDQAYVYHPLRPLHSLLSAIGKAEPALIIPCDEAAVAQLLRLYRRKADVSAGGAHLSALIERSLGQIDGYDRIATRSNLLAIAAATVVQIPESRLIASSAELSTALSQLGFPAVLKADYSWAGDGIHIVHSAAAAERTFRRMSRLWQRIRAVKRLLRDSDFELLLQRFQGRTLITLQRFIAGKNANIAVACWQGEVVASLCVEVVTARSATSTSCVLRVVDNDEMLETARRIVRWSGVSGFCGFDYVIDERSRLPYLIEINPRATQINHLALGPGRDLVAALCARAAGEPVSDRAAVTDSDTIALFPHEWHRNPQSAYLRSAYHDVPWEEPELIRINAQIAGAPISNQAAAQPQ